MVYSTYKIKRGDLMLPSERQSKMFDLMNTRDIVTISELMSIFEISIETVRRDLSILEKSGKIEKVYGGAKIKKPQFIEPKLEDRLISNLNEKNRIAKKCSEMIKDGECIYIDSGTTTYHIAKYIKNKKDLTIITNSIPVINELLDTDFEVIVIGGKLRKSERSIVSYDYLFNISGINIQKAFICTSGISLKNGITEYNMQEASTRKSIIDRSVQIILASDSSKFNKSVTITVSPLDNIDLIITDNGLQKSILSQFKKNGCNIITV